MNARLRKPAILGAAIAGGYLLTWLAVFSLFVGPEYQYVPPYFLAGWLGGGELPTTIQLFSLSVTIVGAVVVLAMRYFVAKRRTTRSRGVSTPPKKPTAGTG